jgi:hypothetical protein
MGTIHHPPINVDVCPDCGKGTSFDKVSELDQCEDRTGCGYGWFDI